MSELDSFLQAAKQKGASDEFLVALLKEKGWPPSDVYSALGRYYEQATGVPIPTTRGRMESAREAFFHLLAFATLASWIFATGWLWFELIDTWFPDAARGYYYRRSWSWSRVSFQMAAIIVAFPAFVYATRAILAEVEINPDKAASSVGRWLTNIALLIAALVCIGDLVGFVARFLQGGLTVRFTLQCLTVLLLAGAVILYYSRGAAKGAVSPRSWNRGFALAAASTILLSLGLGFLKTGSPADQRILAEDRRRLEDLYQIATRLATHWQQQKDASARTLPADLAELGSPTTPGVMLSDPFTQKRYEYRLLTAPRYEVCATFNAATPPTPAHLPKPAWEHPAGRYCFSLDASRYPEYPVYLNY
jgi:hypothetical protein